MVDLSKDGLVLAKRKKRASLRSLAGQDNEENEGEVNSLQALLNVGVARYGLQLQFASHRQFY